MGQALTEEVERLTILYYGEGGSGKTTHLCHAADLGRILVVNAEAGVKARALKRCGVNTKNIEVYPEPGERVTFDGLTKEWLRIREALHKKPGCYVATVWDSLTEIYALLLEDVREAAEKNAERTGKRQDPRKDYGEMADQVRALVRKFRDLPCHFGASALDRRDIDDDGEVVYRPSVTPSLQRDLNLWFDEIVHTSVVLDDDEEEQYRGLFRAFGKYRGKDRFKIMPRTLVDPTFTRVLSYVEEELTLDKDKIMLAAKKKITTAKD